MSIIMHMHMDAKPEALHFYIVSAYLYIINWNSKQKVIHAKDCDIILCIILLNRTLSIVNFMHEFLYNIIIVTRDYFLHESVEV